jgi:hypothetical protein
VAEGDVLADVTLTPQDLFDLKGTPLPQDAALDELRLKDVPQGATTLRPGHLIDPLVHYAGRTVVRFSDRAEPAALKDLRPFIDRKRQTVVSTHGQLRLDYGKGLLTINAPSAQGASGALGRVGTFDLKNLTLSSGMELGHVVAVSLDDQPLASSKKVLLQVMTEEKATDFRTEPGAGGRQKIVSVGHDPWLVRQAQGVVRFKRPDASRLKVTALDPNGDPTQAVGTADEIKLSPTTLYYLIEALPGVAPSQ